MKVTLLNENASKLFLLLLSMVDFKGICNFSALLKIKTEKIMLFLLTSKKLKTWLISKASIVLVHIKKNHIKSNGS
jgi:hypothetical protein